MRRSDPATPSLDAPAQLLRRAWGARARTPHDDVRLVDEMLSGGDAGFGFGSAALVPEEAVATAVLGARGGATCADPAFTSAFPDPAAAPDLRRLAERARKDGAALGLLEAADGTPVPAWIARGAVAARWARTPDALAALARPDAVLVLIFAPSRSSDLAARVAEAFGLTPLEARLAEAFLFAPTLEIAAAQAGIGRATARDTLARIMAKTGAARSSDVVRRLSEVMSATHEEPEANTALLADAFGLTAAEAGVALELAAGATQKEAALKLGLQPETVRSYAKAALAKTGAVRAKDLGRLVAETRALAGLVAVAEPVFTTGRPETGPHARLRLMPRPGGRRLAFLDYGPTRNRPAIIFHGFVAGRSLPPRLAAALQARGLRPIVPQRPGFGLTSPADGDYLTTAVEDLEDLAAALGGRELVLFARDGGTAAAVAFAARNPDQVVRGVLLNPRSPRGPTIGVRSGPVSRMTRLILEQPHLIEGLGAFIRRRTRSDFLEAALGQTLGGIAPDAAALRDPSVRAQLVRDIQAQFAHASAGYAAEHALYAQGWTPAAVTGGTWLITHSGALSAAPDPAAWAILPSPRLVALEGAGVLAQFSHAEALAELISGGS